MTISSMNNFQSDPALRQEIYELARWSYEDPAAILQREFQNNQHIYILRNEASRLVAFFMTGISHFGELELNYLGLACVSQEYKNRGIIIRLFLRAMEDAVRLRLPAKCWLTTPSTEIFRIINFLFDEVSPSLKFEVSEEALTIARRINQLKQYESSRGNPFIVKGVAKATRYSANEILRRHQHRRTCKNVCYIDQLLNEQHGDRLIMLCDVPGPQKLQLLMERFNYYKECNV